MPLSSESTIAEIEAAYLDNASYSEEGSVAKARAFVTACRYLMLKLPKGMSHQGDNLQLNPELIREEMLAAQAWAEAHSDDEESELGPRVTRADFRNFRY